MKNLRDNVRRFFNLLHILCPFGERFNSSPRYRKCLVHQLPVLCIKKFNTSINWTVDQDARRFMGETSPLQEARATSILLYVCLANSSEFKCWVGLRMALTIWKSFMVGERKGTTLTGTGFQLSAQKISSPEKGLNQERIKTKKIVPTQTIKFKPCSGNVKSAFLFYFSVFIIIYCLEIEIFNYSCLKWNEYLLTAKILWAFLFLSEISGIT